MSEQEFLLPACEFQVNDYVPGYGRVYETHRAKAGTHVFFTDLDVGVEPFLDDVSKGMRIFPTRTHALYHVTRPDHFRDEDTGRQAIADLRAFLEAANETGYRSLTDREIVSRLFQNEGNILFVCQALEEAYQNEQ